MDAIRGLELGQSWLSFDYGDVKRLILNTLDFDASRYRYNADMMVNALFVMGIIRNARDEVAVRMIIGSMLQEGTLEMDSHGLLILPPEEADPVLEKFQGGWFVTIDGLICGPMSEGEANAYIRSNVRTAGQKGGPHLQKGESPSRLK